MTPHGPWRERRGFESLPKLVLLGFSAIAAFFLILEHRAHVFGILPYVLLLVCPVLHLLLHGWHGSGHAGHDKPQKPPSQGEV